MVNIAVLVSSEGDNALQLVKSFNSDSRIHVALCLTDRDNSPVMQEMAEAGVHSEFYPDEIWRNEPDTILDTLRLHAVEVLVLDNFTGILRAEILDAFEGRVIRNGETPLADQLLNYIDARSGRKSVDDDWAETLGVKNNVRTADDNAVEARPWMSNREYGSAEPDRPVSYATNRQAGSGINRQAGFESNRQATAEPMPSTWLVWSVLATVLCCTIPGIVAIIQSARVSSRYYSGDIDGAKRASRNAEIWIIISFVLGVIAQTLYLPLTIAGMI